MKLNCIFVAALFTALPSFAKEVVVPSLPVSPYADTEAVKEMSIASNRTDVREVAIRMQADRTVLTEYEIGFGCDENGNGQLETDEIETIFGCSDEGVVVEHVPEWKRSVCAWPSNLTSQATLEIKIRLDQVGVPVAFSALADETNMLPSISETELPAWVFNPLWNRMRVVRRGEPVASDWMSCKIEYTQFSIRVR